MLTIKDRLKALIKDKTLVRQDGKRFKLDDIGSNIEDSKDIFNESI